MSFSPSHLSSYDCGRKGVLRRQLKLDMTENAGPDLSRDFGLEVHEIAEAWNKDAVIPSDETQAGKVFLTGQKWAPVPYRGKSELRIQFQYGGLEFNGIRDWAGRSFMLPSSPTSSDIPAVLDYKTSTDPETHGLWGRAAFLKDFAAILYGITVAEPDSEILLRWLYFKVRKGEVKAGPKMYPSKFANSTEAARPSDAIVTSDSLVDAFETVVRPRVELITDLRKRTFDETSAIKLAPNLTECSKYGGCVYQYRCAQTLSVQDMITAGFKSKLIEEKMALNPILGKLKGLNAAVQAPAAETTEPVIMVPAKFKGFKSFNAPETTGEVSTEPVSGTAATEPAPAKETEASVNAAISDRIEIARLKAEAEVKALGSDELQAGEEMEIDQAIGQALRVLVKALVKAAAK